MITCDKCKKKPGRMFIYGDEINQKYDFIDLCYDCTKELQEVIKKWKNGKV